MERVMKTRYIAAVGVSILCLTGVLDARAGVMNDLARCLGLGWSDGYHAQSPVPADAPAYWHYGETVHTPPIAPMPMPTPAAAPAATRPATPIAPQPPPSIRTTPPELDPAPPGPPHEARPIRIPPPTRTSRWGQAVSSQ
jgi:hypothetical protein